MSPKMVVLFALIGLLLFVAGSIGLFITFDSHIMGSIEWIHGTLTYGVFIVIGLAIIIYITAVTWVRD